MKSASFEYHAPTTVDEAVSLLDAHGDEARILAGGQSLVPLMALRLATPSVLIDLNRVSDVDFVHDEGDSLTIGALGRHRDIEEIPNLGARCPMIAEAVGLIGHVGIRNRGTVVGSLAHADPSAEWSALLLALGGSVKAVGPQGTRSILAEDLIHSAMTTTLLPVEVAVEVTVSIPQGRVGSAFIELSRRHGDFALAGVGAVITLNDQNNIVDSRLALIGAEDYPRRIPGAEDVLRNERPTSHLFKEAAHAVYTSVNPRPDLHGTASFRRTIVEVLARRAMSTAAERALAERQ